MALIMDELEAIYQRGYQLRCEGRYAEAKFELERVLSKNPSHINSRHQLGLIQGFQGDFDGSLLTLANLCSVAPRNLDVLYDLAMTQMMLGMNDEACANFRKIVSIDPANDRASKQLAFCP
jgi:tetratricopeptide (TPR) repeat protein